MDTTHNHAANKLDGSKTHENLSRAFDDKARYSTIYSLYAQKAHDEGLYDSERLFNEVSDNSTQHASLWYGYLDGIQDTSNNLSNSLSMQDGLYRDYSDMADTADSEGFNEIAEKMRLMQQVDNNHKTAFSDMIKKLDQGESAKDANTHWRCTTCGFDTYGDHAPERCPLCSYPSHYFDMMS